MAPDVTAEIRALQRLDLQGLREAWRVRYGPAPKLRSPELLRLALAWRIQMDCEGGLNAATRRRLVSGAAVGRTDHVGRGVRIKREWRGRTYEVERTEDGYRWEDQLFASLSSVAQAITGVKCNGPKFFGLREEGAA